MSDTITTEPPATPEPTRSVGIRVVRAAAWISLLLGLLLLGFVVQQLFVTSWFAERNQPVLEQEARQHFANTAVTRVPMSQIVEPTEPATTPETDEPPPLVLVEAPPEEHEAFAIIRIPTIEKLRDGWTVVEGVARQDLRNGAGHMPQTPLPGQPGNAVISGHRTTYGAPFHDLDKLETGDIIEVETALGIHVYEVTDLLIVEPTDVWVTNPIPGGWLTLTTCNPKFSSRQRLVVVSRLIEGPNAEAILSA